jgi:hypothetical protein
MSKTDIVRYHGGSPPEEIAALSSLALGVRLRAGGMTRWFQLGDDVKGIPFGGDGREPLGILIQKKPAGWVLPSAAEGAHSLDAVNILETFVELAPADATALVKATRLYQDALWLVETEPSLAWLMLVSGLETAANRWGQNVSENPADRLEQSMPETFRYLKARLSEADLAGFAEQIVDKLGATSKFVKFVMEFLPPPPTHRPPAGFQLSWDQKGIKNMLQKVYDYRSRALHDGTPFPFPMCHPADDGDHQAPAEVPQGFATSTSGGTWLAHDTPVCFHTFEYIARSCLLKWWERAATAKTPCD